MSCEDLAKSLNLSPGTLTAAFGSSSGIDDTWSIGSGLTLAGVGTMALSRYVQSAGASSIGGGSVANTISGFKTYGNILAGIGVGVSGYQAIDAYQNGDTGGAVLSSADAAIGLIGLAPGADVPVAGYFFGRMIGDVGYAAASPGSSLIERLAQYQEAGCT